MSDDRFQRLEDKVDNLKEDVTELKTDFKIHVSKMEDRLDLFEDHITGDNKIISKIEPLLERMPELAEVLDDKKYRERAEEEKGKLRRKITWFLGTTSVLAGLFVTYIKFFQSSGS